MKTGELTVEIDKGSGFCFGVVNAIASAEAELEKGGMLYCLGDIVHNSSEVARLETEGLVTIDHEQMKQLQHVKVLLRAHGEPPTTYKLAQENNIEIIDATCPVVLKLQQKIKEAYLHIKGAGTQIVIYGKNGHAEVNGLVGQTDGTAIVIEGKDELDKLDYTRPIMLYAQTTKSVDGFKIIVEEIEQRMIAGVDFSYYDTICRQVANRLPHITAFAQRHDLVLFVSGKKSSNGRVLFEECRKVNPNSYLVSDCNDIQPEWLQQVNSIGVCGATSTPKWLMEQVSSYAQQIATKL